MTLANLKFGNCPFGSLTLARHVEFRDFVPHLMRPVLQQADQSLRAHCWVGWSHQGTEDDESWQMLAGPFFAPAASGGEKSMRLSLGGASYRRCSSHGWFPAGHLKLLPFNSRLQWVAIISPDKLIKTNFHDWCCPGMVPVLGIIHINPVLADILCCWLKEKPRWPSPFLVVKSSLQSPCIDHFLPKTLGFSISASLYSGKAQGDSLVISKLVSQQIRKMKGSSGLDHQTHGDLT